MKSKSKSNKKNTNESVSGIHIFSYRLLHNHVQFLYPRLTKLEKSLKQAMMPIPFDVYVCSMVFLSMIAGGVGLVVGIALALIVNIQPIAFAFLLPIIAGLGIGTAIFFVLQMLPAIHVKNRA